MIYDEESIYLDEDKFNTMIDKEVKEIFKNTNIIIEKIKSSDPKFQKIYFSYMLKEYFYNLIDAL